MTLRVLCVGYSVTEQRGYVERANELAAAEGRDITFLKSGWGGHSLPSIAYLIDEILDALPCDFLLLELFTGNVRFFKPRQMRVYLDEILAAAARRGLPVAFLNLFQSGVDYEAEPVAALIEEYRALYRIPRLDIATVFAAAGGADITYLLKDGTHVAPAGAELYGLLVYAFLRVPPPGLGYVGRFETLPRRFVSLPLRTLPGQSCPFELRRNGIPLHFMEIAADQRIQIDLGRSYRVLGVLLTYGPTSGWMMFWRGRRKIGVCAYDEASYYTRSFLMPVYFRSARRFGVVQLSYPLEIHLRKGEASQAPRLGRLSHVFCQRALSIAARGALLRHRMVRACRLRLDKSQRRPRG